MILLKKIRQHRYDFWGDWKCEHCGSTFEGKRGYDDENFFKNVIPKLPCPVCFKNSKESEEFCSWYDDEMNEYQKRKNEDNGDN